MDNSTGNPGQSLSLERLLAHVPGMVYRCRILEGFNYVLEYVSKGCEALLGMSREEMLRGNWNTVERMTHPDDLAYLRETEYDSIVAVRPYQMSYRLILAGGVIKWIWDQGEVVVDENGKPVWMEGLMQDVSEQKFTELKLREEYQQLRKSISNVHGLGGLVGSSPAMQELYPLILKAAESDTNVIIYGETGTGKDVAARTIHALSDRRGSYIPVNCAAIPEQLLESEFFGHVKGAFSGAHNNHEGYLAAADGGTLFLDELGELPLHLQVKLLRALENKMFTPVGGNNPRTSNFRLISATNQNLPQLVREKKMRSDFYYRVHVLALHMPPLRERKSDIPLLVEMWQQKNNLHFDLPMGVRLAMEHYDWPGNVRELHNFLDTYQTFGDTALGALGSAPQMLPEIGFMTLEAATLQLEERMIRHALEQKRWRRGLAAQALGLNLRTLQRKMKRLGLGD